MSDVEFDCQGVEPELHAAAPTVVFRMRVTESTGARVHALALRCQVRVEPLHRQYSDQEGEGLADLFGGRSRWGQTLKPLQLAFLTQMVTGFTGTADFDLPMPCSYDFEVAANKYLDALRDGEVPLLLLFSGTVFTGRPGSLEVSPVPWHKETSVRMPVRVWRETMDAHFPGQAWLRLGRDTFDRLSGYRSRHQLVGWDDAVERLLKEAGEE